MWRHTDPGPSHHCGLTWPFYLRPALSELSSVRIVSMLERLQTRMAPKWGVLLLDVIMNIAVVIYSWHLIHWRRSGLCLFLKGMHPPNFLNVSMFVQIRVGPIYDMSMADRHHDVEQASWSPHRGVVLHYYWEYLTKVCSRLFIKTLNNHVNLWKMGIHWPL